MNHTKVSVNTKKYFEIGNFNCLRAPEHRKQQTLLAGKIKHPEPLYSVPDVLFFHMLRGRALHEKRNGPVQT